MICRVVIGHYNVEEACRLRTANPEKPVTLKEIAQLQQVHYELFGIMLPLAKYLTEAGVLSMESVTVTREMYQVACLAHELFGMSAADLAHRVVMFPDPEHPSIDRETVVNLIRKVVAIDDMEIQRQAESFLQSEQKESEFRQSVREFVRKYLRNATE